MRCADLGGWQPPYLSVKVERHERKYTRRIVSEQEFRSLLTSLDEAMREAALKVELKYGREVKGGFTAHSFRHTFISRLAERSLPRETIMKLSGHTSIQGIEPYLHATPESITRAALLITGGDGFLTGGGVNGVVQVTGVAESAAPKPLNKRQLPPAQRVSRD